LRRNKALHQTIRPSSLQLAVRSAGERRDYTKGHHGMNSRQLAQKWPYPRHNKFVKQLRSASATWFASKQFPSHPKMDYCLSSWDEWDKNIILKEVADYIKQCKAECEENNSHFPLHKYLHHGLSSQAIAFNLIGPLITRNDYKPLVELLNDKGISVASEVSNAEFEYEDRDIFNEDSGQPTSIDIVLKDSNGKPIIFIESKLVEQEFGGCSVFSNGDCEGRNPLRQKDDCYLHFIGRNYWNLMEEFDVGTNLQNEKQCIFVAHYQFFREVLFSLKKGGFFVLLSDQRSPVFHCEANGKHKGIMPFLIEFIPPIYRSRIVSISIQEVVERLKTSKTHRGWVEEFQLKYGIA
jgi:hypothetical protein